MHEHCIKVPARKRGVDRPNNTLMAAAVALGLAIPALIFAFMRLGAALWFDCQNRSA